jgi:CubicO group peptidase (beta-lactamase class C family)
MSDLREVASWLRSALPKALADTRVPGAAVGMSLRGETFEVADGVLNLSTGVPVTTDSIFQVGSVTKIWTATMVMQLVDAGVLGLDDRVQHYLPEFHLLDGEAASKVTVRHLLSHTGGFEGDVYEDTGDNDDCVERLIAGFDKLPQISEPGEIYSYSNAGYCLLGRIIEVLRGKSFDACLSEYLIQPLGLTHIARGPNEALSFRAALGHLEATPGGELVPSPFWGVLRSNGPAGAMLSMSPIDLIAFVQMHLDGGRGSAGSQIVSEASATAMTQREVEFPYLGTPGNAYGLGWEIFDPTTTVIGHDGATLGQTCYLRALPREDFAVVLLTNSQYSFELFDAIVRPIVAQLTGHTLPPRPAPSSIQQVLDADRYLGRYTANAADLEVLQEPDGHVWLERTPKGIFAALGVLPSRVELVALDGDTLITAGPDHGAHVPHAFLGADESGRAAYLHTGRADRRVDDARA